MQPRYRYRIFWFLALLFVTGCGNDQPYLSYPERTPITTDQGANGPVLVRLTMPFQSCVELHEPTIFLITVTNIGKEPIDEQHNVPIIDLKYVRLRWIDLQPDAPIPYELRLLPGESITYPATLTFTSITLPPDGIGALQVMVYLEKTYTPSGVTPGGTATSLHLYACADQAN